MRGTATSPKLATVFLKNPGQDLGLNFLVRQSGLTESQVKSSAYTLLKNGKLPGLHQPIQGVHVWRYEPPRSAQIDAVGEVYECIGQTAQGQLLVRDSDGTLYVLQEVKL
jgi:hypothetical protein